MRRIQIIIVMAITVILIAQTASAVLLSDLLPGGSLNLTGITFEDKVFTNFREFDSNASGSNAVIISAGDIEVLPTQFGDEIGLIFITHTMNIGAQSTQDTFFVYDVIPDPSQVIVDNTLFLLSSQTTITVDQAITGVEIIERVLDADGNENALKTDSGLNTLFQVDFGPQSKITVETAISLVTDPRDPEGEASITSFLQLYSQAPVPEPSTILDHFLSYKVRRTKGTPKFEKREVTLTDQFESGVLFEVKKPKELYNPADKNSEGIINLDTHLLGYEI